MEQWGWLAVMGQEPADYNLIVRMGAALATYRAVKALRSAKGKDIHRLSPEQDDLIVWLLRNGLLDYDEDEE